MSKFAMFLGAAIFVGLIVAAFTWNVLFGMLILFSLVGILYKMSKQVPEQSVELSSEEIEKELSQIAHPDES